MTATIIFIVLAAIFKAVADTTSHHISTSVFRYLNPQFWDANWSGFIKRIPGTNYPFNAWHIANSLMIWVFIIPLCKQWWHFPLYGFAFVVVFNLFYNKILRKK